MKNPSIQRPLLTLRPHDGNGYASQLLKKCEQTFNSRESMSRIRGILRTRIQPGAKFSTYWADFLCYARQKFWWRWNHFVD